MTAQKLYDVLQFVSQLDNQLRLQASLNTIRDMLNNLVSQPANPQFQSSLGSALADLSNAAGKLQAAITPSQASTIAEMGGEEFFTSELAERVQEKISSNAMTPSVARDYVTDLVTRRAAFMDTVQQTMRGLQALHVQTSNVTGQADIAFLIPYELFGSGVGDFAKELLFINRLIEHVHEAATGEPEPATLVGLSSSTPTVSVTAAVTAVSLLATIITKFLDTWERILKFRKVREELTELGMKGTAVEELTEQVTTIIEETVEESTQVVIAKYEGSDDGRKNELENALRTDIKRLYGQIERGLTVEFRANPDAAKGDEDKETMKSIIDLGSTMRFPGAARDPLVLQSGEVLEGEIYHRKVRTTKTSTSEKRTPKRSG